MKLHRGLAVIATAFGAGSLVLLACGDGENVRFEGEDAAVDASSEARLPSSSESGADGPVDVPDARRDVDAAAEPVVCAGSPCATQIAGGDGFFCVVLSDGGVSCWGKDVMGSLGRAGLDGGVDAVFAPARVDGLSNVTQVSARQNVCARTKSGAVTCWGRNDYGQLGLTDPDGDAHPVPSEVTLGEAAVRVDVNDQYVCAVLASGQLACWGLNNLGLLVRDGGSTPYIASPDLAGTTAKAVRSSTGSLLSEDGRVWTWGVLLGRETSIPVGDPLFAPMPIPGLERVSDIASEAATTMTAARAGGHACVVTNGDVYCWGAANPYGALCTGIGNAEPTPAYVSLPMPARVYAQQVALTSQNTCVRATDGKVWCCGVDDLGQLGTGAITDGGVSHVYQGKPFAPTFQQASAETGHVVQVAVGGGAVCALLQGGEVECWGSNESGQLGLGTRDGNPHPTPVRVVLQ